jgi:hypothetical protein
MIDMPGYEQPTHSLGSPDLVGIVEVLHCPSCGSPDPRRHPANQFEGEVALCSDSFHVTDKPTQPKLGDTVQVTITWTYKPNLDHYPAEVTTVDQAAEFDRQSWEEGNYELLEIIPDTEDVTVTYRPI